MIVAIAGPPCAGKSTLGESLAARRGIPHLEMDVFRVRLMPFSAHTREDRAVAYRAMHYAAELLAASGSGVIVNACYDHAEDRIDLERSSRRAGVPFFLIECTVSAEVAVTRSRARWDAHPGADLTPDRVTELVVNYPFSGQGVTVDSQASREAGLAAAEAYITAGDPVIPGRWSSGLR